MTIQEILKILQQLPMDATIEITYDGGHSSVYPVEFDGFYFNSNVAVFKGHK